MIPYARAAIIAALVAFGAVQTARLSGERERHAQTKEQHAGQLRRIADATAAETIRAMGERTAKEKAVAATDAKQTQEKANALSDNDARRAADRAGSGGMRIPASCPRPAAPSDLPSAAPAASVDSPAAEVTAAFRQELWDLRAALISERAQLLALQDYARQCAGEP